MICPECSRYTPYDKEKQAYICENVGCKVDYFKVWWTDRPLSVVE